MAVLFVLFVFCFGKGQKIARRGKGFVSVTTLNHFQGWIEVFLIKEE